VRRLGQWLTPRDAGLLGRYRRRLILAGFQQPAAVPLFLGAEATVAGALACSYVLYGVMAQRALPNVLPVSVILGGLGWFVPDVWLRFRTRQRQRAITNALPDVLDLLMVCVEAGLGFDSAVARVAEQEELTRSPFHQELMRMHLEVRAGRPREEALRSLGERCGVQEVRSMVSAFVQSDRLGTPLGKTLRVHAESARIQRRHRAEERASLAPLKMIFPTVLFLMPAFFLVAMAPSLIGLLKSFRSLVQ
jgi:tight adherence protein C